KVKLPADTVLPVFTRKNLVAKPPPTVRWGKVKLAEPGSPPTACNGAEAAARGPMPKSPSQTAGRAESRPGSRQAHTATAEITCPTVSILSRRVLWTLQVLQVGARRLDVSEAHADSYCQQMLVLVQSVEPLEIVSARRQERNPQSRRSKPLCIQSDSSRVV